METPSLGNMKNQLIKIILVSAMVFCFFQNAYADTGIHLDIETGAGSLYNQDITVTSCNSDNNTTTNLTDSAYCAILQSGVANNWSWYGTDGFLNSLGGFANDFSNNLSWGWFGNLTYGSTSLSSHVLTPGENLLLNYNINPLKLTISNPNPSQYDTVTATLTQFGLDSSYNPTWTPATTGGIVVNGTSFPLASDGTYSLKLDSTTPYVISGTETNFINSNTITLNPTPVIVASGGGQLTNSGSSTPVIVVPKPTTKKIFDTQKAIDFLTTQQKDDGSFGVDLYTDWITLALAGGNYQNQVLKLIKYFEKSKAAASLTDYERHAMALLSLGLNPYDTNGENYIQKIITSFDGKQFGDPNENNDDVFALIVLQNVGYDQNEPMIKSDVDFILTTQSEDGSWNSSVDMTGATIEALSSFSPTPGVGESLKKAENFLKQSQKENGGWNDSPSSTAWALEGILAMNEKMEDWTKNNNTPLDYFATIQDTDGGVKDENLQNKIWETAYVSSVLSGNSWNQIMQKFNKQETTINDTEIKPIQKNTEVSLKNNSTIKITSMKIKKSENLAIKTKNTNETTQNTATAINAITDSTTKVETPKKNWFVRLLNNIFGSF